MENKRDIYSLFLGVVLAVSIGLTASFSADLLRIAGAL